LAPLFKKNTTNMAVLFGRQISLRDRKSGHSRSLSLSDKPGRGSCRRRESERMHEGEVDTTVDAVARERFRVEAAEAATNPFPPHFVPLAARRPLVGDRQAACLFKVSKASHAISS